ncbi:hypothetical protein MOQ_003834, partial [Trypanosoma cruzi marinkellei]
SFSLSLSLSLSMHVYIVPKGGGWPKGRMSFINESVGMKLGPADVGILFCCIVSLICKVKVFTLTQKDSHTSSVFFSTDTERFVQNSSTSPQTTPTAHSATLPVNVMSTSPIVTGGISQLQSNLGTDGYNGKPSVPFSNEQFTSSYGDDIVGTAVEVTDAFDIDEDYDEGPIMSLFSLPLTQRVMVGVSWLSVISNCLTYLLRPSQVLYAFFFCICDMVLHVMDGRLNRKGGGGGGGGSCSPASSISRFSGAATTTQKEGIATGANLRVGEKGCCLPATLSDRCTEVRPGASLKTNPLFLTEPKAYAYMEGEYTPSHTLRIKKADWRGESGGGWGKLRNVFKYWHYIIHRRALFIVVLNTAMLFVLVIFHIYHLFFWVGTMSGYLACCGTLYVLGCDVGVLLQLLGWLCTQHSSRLSSPLSLYSPVHVVATLRTFDLCSASLPPTGVMLNQWLSILYITQMVFSFASSILYFCMLLEEGEELYSTHMEFMRWYMGTIGLGLLDIARILLFGSILWLSGGPKKKLSSSLT